MNKTFRLIKPDGDLDITYCKGSAKSDWLSEKYPARMTFTLESPDNVFKFVLLNPSEDDQKLRAEDVEGLHPRYVLFRNGRKISSPDFILCKTEELPADERIARYKALEQLAGDMLQDVNDHGEAAKLFNLAEGDD